MGRPHHQSIYYGVNSKFIRMKFLRKILLVGLLPGFLISQAQNVQNKEDVPLDLGYRVNSYAIYLLQIFRQY